MKINVPFLGSLIVCCLYSAAGCGRKTSVPETAAPKERVESSAAGFDFADATTLSGLKSVYRNGEESQMHSIVESLGGGVGAFDFDLDGKLDLIFPGGGTINANQPLSGNATSLWRHLNTLRFSDVSLKARIATPRCYTHGCAAADFDNDGFTDVLVTGYGNVQLLHNQGDGTFDDITETANINDSSWSSSAAWGDFNGDGNLDLYVAHYVDWSWKNHPKCPTTIPGIFDVCTPNDFGPLNDEVFQSNGDGTFRAASTEFGLVAGGKGLGVLIADFNGDSHVDVYVANDTTNNFLYINNGREFEDTGIVSGVGLDGSGTPNGSMGIATLDFDDNLEPDIWVTNYENETYALYENTGETRFLWATERAGLNALGKSFVGFGTVAADFDLDGDEDIVVSNGHVMLHPAQSKSAQQSVLLENTVIGKTKRLVRHTFDQASYFSADHRGRGVVTGDWDSDGDLDLVFTNTGEQASILSNESPRQGKLFTVRLVGRNSNRDAIGSRLILETNKRKYLRMIVGGGSYLSQSSYEAHWGIPSDEQLLNLEIHWPDGTKSITTEFIDGQAQLIVQ